MSLTVRAAGGVVWRRGPEGLEVLLVHRPRRRDWSFPKGKARRGESDEECALREVEEETGLGCELGPELTRSRYLDSRGRVKTVRYWAMALPESAEPVPGDGVDEWRWLPSGAAEAALTWARDRDVLRSLPAEKLG